MKIAELFKHMIDLLDQEEQTQQEPTPTDELGVMVPPLQQKLEILKKSQGMENVYDEEPTDELDLIKRNAGIAVITAAEEDEPFEG
jgi:negative regulator of genetic competence, sporulation and motility